MPDQPQPLDLTIGPTHATSFSVDVPFYANQVNVNDAINSLQETVESLRREIVELRGRLDRLS